jgi:hypothetical protein
MIKTKIFSVIHIKATFKRDLLLDLLFKGQRYTETHSGLVNLLFDSEPHTRR